MVKFITCFILSVIIFAEDDLPANIEIFIYYYNISETTELTFTVIDESWNSAANDYQLINSYDPQVISENSNVENATMGLDFIGSTDGQDAVEYHHSNGYGVFPYGLMKVTVNLVEDFWFYIDTRDSDYPYSDDCECGQNDLCIEFDGNNNTFSYGVCFDEISISHNDTLKYWNILKDYDSQSYDKFQPTNPTNLSYSVVNGHPRFSYSKSFPPSSKYKLFRNNVLIANNITGTNYTDYTTSIPGNNQFNFKVRANLSSADRPNSPGYSNTVTVKRAQSNSNNKTDKIIPNNYNILNFPNPFNPETTIKYELPEPSHVQLTIFDIKGRKIITLKNELIYEGSYSINWRGIDNEGNLVPSGMYIFNFYAKSLESDLIFNKSQKVVLIK